MAKAAVKDLTFFDLQNQNQYFLGTTPEKREVQLVSLYS